MVEGLRRIAAKLELPKAPRLATKSSSSSSSSAPGAGEELAEYLAERCAELHERRRALDTRASLAERRFVDEARSVDKLAGEWRAFQSALGTLGVLGEELRKVRARMEALMRACDELESACTLGTEAEERERSQHEATRRTRALEGKMAAARRSTERLERELEEAAVRAEHEAEKKARQRIEAYKSKVEEAFGRAAKRDMDNWKAKHEQPQEQQDQKQQEQEETKKESADEVAPLLEEDKQQLEKMLDAAPPVTPGTTPQPSSSPSDAVQPHEEQSQSEDKKEDEDEKKEQEEKKKTRKRKVPKVLGDIDEP